MTDFFSLVTPAVVDLFYLVLFWAPGTILASASGEKNKLMQPLMGFMISAALATLVFSLAGTAEILGTPVRHVVFILVGLAGLFLSRRALPSLLRFGLVPVLVLSTVAVASRNLLRLDGRPLASDQFLIGWIAHRLGEGLSPETIGTTDLVKRGFAYPILLGFGADDRLLISMTTVIWMLAIIAAGALLIAVTGSQITLRHVFVGTTVFALWATSSLFLALAFYQNGHALASVALTVLMIYAVRYTKEGAPDISFALGALTSGFVLGQARPEGFVLTLLVLIPLLKWVDGGPRARGLLGISVMGGYMGFLIWMITTSGFLFDMVWLPVALIPLLVVFALVARTDLFRWFLEVLPWLSAGILLIGSVRLLFLQDQDLGRWNTFFSNTFLGEGMWGTAPWFSLVGLTALLALRKGRTETLLGFGVLTGILFTIAVKLLDGGLTNFSAGLSNGWGDSINRGLFHVWGPIFVGTVIGLEKILRPGVTRFDRWLFILPWLRSTKQKTKLS